MNRISKIASAALPKVKAKCTERQRDKILRKIYAPFAALKKNSPGYNQLGESGTVWEDYFQPGNSERYGYLRLQDASSRILREIDDLKKHIKPAGAARRLVAEYAHQSVVIENNQLQLADSITIEKHILSTTLNEKLTQGMLLSELKNHTLPNKEDLLPKHTDASQVAELRNHILASH